MVELLGAGWAFAQNTGQKSRKIVADQYHSAQIKGKGSISDPHKNVRELVYPPG